MYESTIHSKYKGKFEISLYDGEDQSKPLSNAQVAYFSFKFDRNSVIADGSLDTYKIKLQNGCILDYGRTSVSDGGVRNANTITYVDSPYSNDADAKNTNTVYMLCDVSKILDKDNNINVSAEVEETIGDKTFTYMDSKFTPIPLMDYYEKHPLEMKENISIQWKWTENEKYLLFFDNADLTKVSYLRTEEYVVPLKRSNFYSTLAGYLVFVDDNGKETTLKSVYDIFYTVWLQNIVTNSTDSTSTYANEISTYVKNIYPNEESLKNASIQLPGLKATRYPTTNGYMWKYEIQENFVGYARTAAVDFTKYNYMYFSTSDSNTLDEAFKMYLDTYPYQGVDEEELRNLVDTKGVSNILKLANTNGDIYINGKHLFHYDASDNRLELIKSNVIRVPFSDEDTMKTTFESELLRIYSEKLSTTAMDTIVASEAVINSLLKNSTLNSNKESYNEYFIVQDGSTYLLVNVYSAGKDSTYVTVSTLDAKLENDTLSFNISDKNQENLLSIVNALDEHFIGRKIHSNLPSYDSYLIVTTSDDITNVVYTIPNKRAYVTFDRQTTTEKEMAEAFIQNLTEVYDGIVAKETIEYVLSFETINKLKAQINPGLYMLRPVSRLNDGSFTMTNLTPYNFYFVVAGQGEMDKDKYWLFNVYTNGYDKVYTTITELAPKGGNGTIGFELQNDNISVLRQIVRALDYYFTGGYLHDTITDTTISVSYPLTSTASIQDSNKMEEIKEVSASLKTSQFNKEYLEVVSEVNNTIDVKSNSIVEEEEEENKKYSNTQDTETNKTTEETEETSNDGSYVPSSDASNVDAGPSSDGGTNLTSSIANEVVEVNSSPTNGIPLVETG